MRVKLQTLSAIFVFLLACGANSDGIDKDAWLNDCYESTANSYGKRFLAGETFFLPALIENETCTQLSWELSASPEGSMATLNQGSDRLRITPLVVGNYTLSVRQGDRVTSAGMEIDVVDPLERPFHNYNYFPSHRLTTVVENTLWIAGVYSPQIARLDIETGEALEPVLVGQWPTALVYLEELGLVLVANKASDTLGFVDVTDATQVDAIWVGDEPSEIVWDPARGLAYISLAGAGQVAVVDVEERTLIKTIDALFDPLALAMTPDGQSLVVASHRSGQSNMYPHIAHAVETEEDVAIIDLDTLIVTGYVWEVASTIQAMDFDADGTLWLTATTNHPEGPLNDSTSLSFQHELFTLELASGLAKRGVSVDLSRQPGSGGSTATIYGFARCGDGVWVAAEGSNKAVELADDLTELRRVSVEGRPRALRCTGEAMWVVSSSRMEVTRIIGESIETFDLGLTDRRDERLRAGLERFTGQGIDGGDNRSCNNCHADGLSDGVVWNAGPVVSRLLSRPFRWLEGTSMIGWDGYVGSVKISGYVGGATINDRGNTEQSLAIGSYLASIMPSPPANSLTQRDGRLSEAAEEGRSIFEGKGGCAGCHAAPLFTNKEIMADGLTPGRTDVPTLVDVARIGAWYKTGIMPTLLETVWDTANKFGVSLEQEEAELLTRYLMELTGRDFFVLDSDLGIESDLFPVDGAITLTFSYPVWNTAENLSWLTLENANGEAVEIEVAAVGRHVTIRPIEALAHDESYWVNVPTTFLADDARSSLLFRSELTTASASDVRLEGAYDLTVWVPMLNFVSGGFDMENVVAQTSRFEASPTANGADVVINLGGDMEFEENFVIEASTLFTPHLPVALGPSFLNGAPIVAATQDTDGDGVVDRVEGTLVLTGPGIELEDIDFVIEQVVAVPGECMPGSEGDSAPTVTQDGDDIIIDWGDGGALALFVAAPEATLPLGPGLVEGGQTFWAVSAASFPTTFAGPVTYGVIPAEAVDSSESNGAPVGGAPLVSGECYRFSVVVDLAYSHTTVLWP